MEHQQVKRFNVIDSDTTSKCNEFLKEIGTRVINVIPIYNTIEKGMEYVVIYWC